jgi:hypothetical protein
VSLIAKTFRSIAKQDLLQVQNPELFPVSFLLYDLSLVACSSSFFLARVVASLVCDLISDAEL